MIMAEREKVREIDRREGERALMLFNGLMQLCVYVGDDEGLIREVVIGLEKARLI